MYADLYHLNKSKIIRNNVLSHNTPPSVLKIHKHFNPPTFTTLPSNANETKKKKNNQYINIIQQQYYKKLLCILCNKKYENILQ